jgi:hypothetical protein
MNTKYVIVGRQQISNRYAAIRGLSFATKAEAEEHVATKMHAYMRQRVHIEERAVKDVDTSQTMHCQCCGRAIHAARGTIAHHGYTRPGWGSQTASCFGAKRLPWEVDRGAVADLIEHLERVLERSIEQRGEVQAETAPVTHNYQIYVRVEFANAGRYSNRTLELTRDTFDAIVRANVDSVFTHRYRATFDEFKARDLDSRDREIEQLKRDIKEFTAKYDGWKQTHKREGDLWVAL